MYMLKKHAIETKAFKVKIGTILFSISYRIKTDSIFLDKEINLYYNAKEKLLAIKKEV